MKQRKTEGFTLIELLVVIAVIAILAAILVPAVTKVITDAKWTEMKSNGKNLFTAVFSDSIDAVIVGFPDGNNGNTTTEYFKNLAGAGAAPFNTTKVIAAAPDFVHGPKPGASPAAKQWSNLVAANIAWQVSLHGDVAANTFDETTDAGTPFLISCNWSGTTVASDTGAAGTQIVDSNIDNTGDAKLNGGDKKICVASYGGGSAVFNVKSRDTIADLNPTGEQITLLAQ